MYINEYSFQKAVPVWKKGDSGVINQTLELMATVNCGNVTLCIAASTVYEVFINGELCAQGPARAAHDYYRVDELSLDSMLCDGENQVTVRVCGYNVNNFAYLDQPSFVCAELKAREEVIAYTAMEPIGFKAFIYNEKVVKVNKFSFQRAIAEAYILGNGNAVSEITLEETGAKRFIARDIPYGEYPRFLPLRICGRGNVTQTGKANEPTWGYLKDAGSQRIKGYKISELECDTYDEYGRFRFDAPNKTEEKTESIVISAGAYADIEFEANRSGLIELEIRSSGEGTVYIAFDEILLEGAVNPYRMGTCSFIPVKVSLGNHKLTTMEPYVFKYMRLVAIDTDITVSGLKQISIAYPKSLIKAEFISDDPQMKLIYDAALNTFCDNTVDIYMDCPSRERAGWLCDSFFTSRVERILSGRSDIEKAFLYNFLYHDKDKNIPDGMLSMCYPSDHYDGTYIPNWAMWYVAELREYIERSGDMDILRDAKKRMYALMDFFSKFENGDGLLEKLDKWVFVDWSEANKLVQEVSYASNMMYAYCLEAVGDMYGDAELRAKAERVRVAVRSQAMTPSGFFCDNAVRDENGELKLSGKCTEACQYYAFFSGVATPESHPELWRRLVNEFGFDRVKKGLYPEIYPANAFIGNYIRLEALCRYGEHDALYDNIKGYFTYMAERTGTLWENNHDRASLNHGFASHVIYWMEKLGLIKKA